MTPAVFTLLHVSASGLPSHVVLFGELKRKIKLEIEDVKIELSQHKLSYTILLVSLEFNCNKLNIYLLLKPIHSERKQKRKLSLMVDIFPLIPFTYSLIFLFPHLPSFGVNRSLWCIHTCDFLNYCMNLNF